MAGRASIAKAAEILLLTMRTLRQIRAKFLDGLTLSGGDYTQNPSDEVNERYSDFSTVRRREPVCPRLSDVDWNSSRHAVAFKPRELCLMIVQQSFQQRVQFD
jgi:hypothetical protein